MGPLLLPLLQERAGERLQYIDCFLLESSLLSFSTDDSFAFHRRFFRLESTILLESSDDSFSEHREYFGKSVNFLYGICCVGFLMEVDYSFIPYYI